MKKVNYIVAAATVILIVVFSAIEPRREKTPPTYNAATETTRTGVVQETKEFYCPLSDEQGMHLLLSTSQGNVMVHVAPARFLRSQGVHFSPQDKIEVIGTRVRFQGQDAMLAREITRGSEVLIVRDHQGHPLWSR